MSTSNQAQNPANKDGQAVVRKRIPMSVPQAKLAVPDIPGFHLHWFRDEHGRIERALQASYEFVKPEEVRINNTGIGTDSAAPGSTDLGSRVSIAAGGFHEGNGQAIRMYLMKLPEELWRQDQDSQLGDGSQLDNIRKSLAGGLLGADSETSADKARRYVDATRTKLPAFLQRKS